MKYLLILLSLILTTPAYAQKTKAAVTTEINTNFADNNVGAITPALLRATTLDIVNSYVDYNGSSTFACAANKWVSSGTTSVFTCTQPAFTDISGSASLAQGGAGAALTASNGGIVYSGASSLSILAGTPSSGQCLLSGASGPPTWGSCPGGGGGSGIVNAGLTGQLTYYGANGTTVSGLTNATIVSTPNLSGLWTFNHTPDSLTVNTGVLYIGSSTFAAAGSSPYSLILNWQNIAGELVYFQKGITGTLWAPASSSNALGGQALGNTGAGLTLTGLTIDMQGQAGTGGGVQGIQIIAQVNTAWVPGVGGLPGANAIETTGKSNKGGHVWGGDFTGWCLTVACVETYGIEVNVRNEIAATQQSSGIWLVNKNTVVPTAGSALLISGENSNVGFPTAGIYFATTAGFSPLTTAATVLKTDAITFARGIDFTLATCSTDCYASKGFSVGPTGAISSGLAGTATGQISLVGTTSGTAIIKPQGASGSPTLTLGTASGTPAVTATAPLAIATSTGNITFDTSAAFSWTGQHTWTAARTIASATAATLDDLFVPSATTTVTGNTGSPITALSKMRLQQPTLTDASAVVVSTAATLDISGPPIASGLLTITAPWTALFESGNVGVGAAALPAPSLLGATGGGLYVGGFAGALDGFFQFSDHSNTHHLEIATSASTQFIAVSDALCIYNGTGFCKFIVPAISGGVTVGPTQLVTIAGEIAMAKALSTNAATITISAPGAGGGVLLFACGTTAGTAALYAGAGTSITATKVLDNIGSGVTGC